jgi:putative FmdB family regulatory protein
MPVYEYECGKCGVFEHSQRINDAALTKCPTCRRKVRRLISSTSFQLKGTGWYVTDYAKKGAKDAESKAETKGESKTESTSEPKSDSKTETKTSKTESKTKADTKSGTTPATTAS